MLVSDTLLRAEDPLPAENAFRVPDAELAALLRAGFGASFAILDGENGELVHASADQPTRDWSLRAELCREVARRGRPELIEDEDPLVTLAVPIAVSEGRSRVAVATFVSRDVRPDEDLPAAAALGMRTEEALAWALGQTPCAPATLLRTAELVLQKLTSDGRVRELEGESESLSDHLSQTYEEISLLHRLTQNLRISAGDEDLAHIALGWLEEVLPASGLAVQLLPFAEVEDALNREARTEPLLITYGDCPLDNDRFTALVECTHAEKSSRPVVVNHHVTGREDWPEPQIRQMIVVSLAEGENVFGWLAIFNHAKGEEFGTIEASLISSVAVILGIHSGNLELYRQQSETLAGIVRALTSAIDAKDPYTCGHSDRVAQISVRLAEELGCDAKMLDEIYLSGLLHDIGKIGINDSVLRKPDKLSDDEYEHIKQHVEIGHKILNDLGKLEHVLPVILHHHESWDGGGYPAKLGSERIPMAARIVAVADSYDAMSSDRPYRKGMPEEKIHRILRGGSDQQWDPEVIDAFFRACDDIHEIAQGEQGEASTDPDSAGCGG